MAGKRIWHQPKLVEALGQGAWVVTASDRLARALLLAYAENRQQAGQAVWERPRVLTWGAFLSDQVASYQNALFGGQPPTDANLPQLLTNTQTQALWERIVQGSDAAGGLLQPVAAAQAAQSAWNQCHAYGLDWQPLAASANPDARQFAAWAQIFDARCRHANWLDSGRLPDLLSDWVAAGELGAPPRLLFVGFDEWTPQQAHLLQTLRDAGSDSERLAVETGEPPAARLLRCNDAEQEIWLAARWAAACLQRDPRARIGIAVRDLSSQRDRYARILDQVLCPSSCSGNAVARPYNLSLGQPLVNWPVINDALLFLQLAGTRLEFDTVSRVLHSPFLRGAETEQWARVACELHLREGSETLSLKRFADTARKCGGMSELEAMLDASLEWLRVQPREQLPSRWAQAFADLLQHLGWPGERQHDSSEHQAVDAFREVLAELARLDTLLGAVQLNEARHSLLQLVTQRPFQPATEEVPIQVLGIPETAGLHFNYLWIAGLSDDVWPASPRPDPLLPVELQRQLMMPHASARRELEFAQRLTSRLLASAPEIVVSVAERDADQELRPSPLIANLPEISVDDLMLHAAQPYSQFLQTAAPELESLDDSRVPGLPAGEMGGGTGILKSQAACPFQAFARYRLGAETLPVPGPGLDAAERGGLLHDILRRVWGELESHATLNAMDSTALQALLDRHVAAALAQLHAVQPDVLTPKFMELEQQRLVELLTEWLQTELQRAPFSVAQREHQQRVQIGPLALNTRVDRIDRLTDGSHVIIDYKTGDAKPNAWRSERPDEPQLPCYAVTASEQVTGVLFGVLRPGAIGYRGYMQAADMVPGIGAFENEKYPPDGLTDWKSLLNHWHEVVTQLAERFAAGEAHVDPKDRNRSCAYCHLAALCRIDEIQQAGDREDD